MKFIKRYCEDFIILCGAASLVYATFRLSIDIGFFVLGAALLALGFALAKNPPKVK